MTKTLVQFLQDAANRFGPRPALFFKPSIRGWPIKRGLAWPLYLG